MPKFKPAVLANTILKYVEHQHDSAFDVNSTNHKSEDMLHHSLKWSFVFPTSVWCSSDKTTCEYRCFGQQC